MSLIGTGHGDFPFFLEPNCVRLVANKCEIWEQSDSVELVRKWYSICVKWTLLYQHEHYLDSMIKWLLWRINLLGKKLKKVQSKKLQNFFSSETFAENLECFNVPVNFRSARGCSQLCRLPATRYWLESGCHFSYKLVEINTTTRFRIFIFFLYKIFTGRWNFKQNFG